FFLPWLDKSPVRSGNYRPLFKRFFWLLVIDVILLGWAGGGAPTPLRNAIGQISAAYYFLHFLVILPLVSRFETTLPLPRSISESVLEARQAEAAPAETTKKRGGRQAAAAAH
ncbi:MAG TPA: cytochrome b, partial [Sphingomicrobium sp.]|nr:cytochrome b [Sphingomicrobium sp.]